VKPKEPGPYSVGGVWFASVVARLGGGGQSVLVSEAVVGFSLREEVNTSEFSHIGLCWDMYTAVGIQKACLIMMYDYENDVALPGLNCLTSTKAFLVLLKMRTEMLYTNRVKVNGVRMQQKESGTLVPMLP